MEGLTHITINGTPHPVYFGMEAVEYFAKKHAALKEGSLFGIKELAHMVYGGLLNHATINDTAPQVAFSAVYLAVEEKYYTEEGGRELIAITEAFNESRAVKHFSEAAEESKKKEEIDFEELRAFAFGELGLSPKDYFRLTWRQYNQKCAGYFKRLEREGKQAWQNTRAVMWIIGAANAKDPKQYPTLEQFLSDKGVDSSRIERLKERLKAFKEKASLDTLPAPAS